ncbi:cell division protein FtsQ/DivIB [Marinospirillum alkaliphilum]|uniref:Cell division protein FtsQ n=1 Tax=Marinospirillum alkaliphilum DSM 21637 TaxID=1122209 RepID=A0A1K1TRT2_9GAMM|nr:cell division protein FtsQ/DivIB [Marinospirillum alkaliphilum]SFX03264.1 cell division protein FtsQ [Marinospirillum alkaliphilum DSM 21637]
MLFWLRVILPLVVLLLLVGYWLNWTLARPVGQVAIYGEVRHSDLAQLQQRALPWLEEPFWKVDLQGLKQALEQDPWLKKVQISRHWPDRIQLDLVEREAWARWNETALIDVDGQGFHPPTPVQPLPARHIHAGVESMPEAVQLWHKLEPLLEARDLELTGLRYEARGSWQLELDGAVRVLVGRDNMEARINRFLWAWTAWLAAESEKIERIDLRYPNGMSVAWLESGRK